MADFAPGDTAVCFSPDAGWHNQTVTVERPSPHGNGWYWVETRDGRKGSLRASELRKVTIVPSAPQTIDHGRLDTLKRRKAFSTVHTELRNAQGKLMFEFPTDTMLSPRRITRIIQANRFTAGWSKRNHGDLAADVADAAYKLLCSFRENGYVLPDVLEQRVRLMRVRLVANDAA